MFLSIATGAKQMSYMKEIKKSNSLIPSHQKNKHSWVLKSWSSFWQDFSE